MRKQLFIILGLLTIGQCSAEIKNVADAAAQLSNIAKLVKHVSFNQMNQVFFDSWKNNIDQITNYAIKNSKNAFGIQDKNIIEVAQNTREVSNRIIQLCIAASMFQSLTSAYKQQFIQSIAQLDSTLSAMYKKINTSHLTPSKKNAKQALHITILTFRTILQTIEQKIS